jgi:hypothetical protein
MSIAARGTIITTARLKEGFFYREPVNKATFDLHRETVFENNFVLGPNDLTINPSAVHFQMVMKQLFFTLPRSR